MEVVQVQSVVDDLIHVLGRKSPFANLELEDEDDRPDDDDRIDSAAHTRNGELEVERAGVSRQDALQEFGLLEPCVPLSPGQVEVVPPGHSREDLVPVGCTEFRERARVVGPLGGGTKCRTFHVGEV
jgi:hypothetical protein